ncbi:unnamed protein product [Cylicocyclus nassatus]|uniref:Uncharacterized protein n=1 Tax=Cylicocyclus nassatus TaxID=53992 RepID=A0AA36LZH1_CYLNA|nr:unnamed protein product [Cylicocyclus nassatus]
MPDSDNQTSSPSTFDHTTEEIACTNNEASPSEVSVPKSAIDVAIELIEQAEIDALEAARIAALNKPKPRGRPPIHRKSPECAPNSSSNMTTTTETQHTISHDNGAMSQDGSMTDNAVVSPKQAAPLFPMPTSLPILKDHLDVEAAPRALLPNAEVSLFGDVDASEQEPADFDKMVFRKYGSTDGRLEDDEEGTSMLVQDRQSVVLTARKDSKFKEFKNPDEEAAVVKRILEEVCPPSSLRVNSPPRTIENEAAVVQRILAEVCPLSSLPAHSSSSATPTKEDGGTDTVPINRKRQPYKRRKGKPKTIKKEENEYVPDPEKAGRPRGRPKKNGANSTPRTNRKSFDKFVMNADRRGRPRRAASMIQDFLELYAKVDLCDLEEVHARATTFVRMLVDEYATTNKEVAKKSSIKEEAKNPCEGNDEGRVDAGSALQAEGCSSNCMDTHSQHEEMDVAMDTNADDGESIDEAGSSGENMAGGLGEESNAEGETEDNVGEARPESAIKELPDSFIDSIPVLRGAALQAVPTSADSVLR